jgi:hypothetical protein
MKKLILSAAAVLAIAVTLVSCGSGGPKANAEKFLNGVFHKDYAAAKEVATEQTRKQLSTIESIESNNVGAKIAKEEARKIKVEVKDPVVTGDHATVEYTVTYPEQLVSNQRSASKTLKMVKQNGKWLAEWSKMDMRGLGGLGISPGPEPEPEPGVETTAPDTQVAPAADAMPADINKAAPGRE